MIRAIDNNLDLADRCIMYGVNYEMICKGTVAGKTDDSYYIIRDDKQMSTWVNKRYVHRLLAE